MKLKVCIRAQADIKQINACKAEISQIDGRIKNLADKLTLAGNAVRLKILFLLNKERELCVCDLSDILEMNVSAISQHLRKLKDGNMVDVRRDGQTYYYFIKEGQLLFLQPFFEMVESKNEILKPAVQ